jgi:tetratricopeptide (TPR) repeat protein
MAVWAQVLILSTGISCGSSQGVADRYYASERYIEAAAAYQSYLDQEPSDSERMARARFRIGVIHAQPGTSLYDPEQAVAVLDRLLLIDPGGPYSTEARLLRDLQVRVLDLDRELESGRVRAAELAAELAARHAGLIEIEEAMDDSEEAVESLTAEIERLRSEIRFLSEELDRRQQELDRLKAIDLAQPP